MQEKPNQTNPADLLRRRLICIVGAAEQLRRHQSRNLGKVRLATKRYRFPGKENVKASPCAAKHLAFPLRKGSLTKGCVTTAKIAKKFRNVAIHVLQSPVRLVVMFRVALACRRCYLGFQYIALAISIGANTGLNPTPCLSALGGGMKGRCRARLGLAQR